MLFHKWGSPCCDCRGRRNPQWFGTRSLRCNRSIYRCLHRIENYPDRELRVRWTARSLQQKCTQVGITGWSLAPALLRWKFPLTGGREWDYSMKWDRSAAKCYLMMWLLAARSFLHNGEGKRQEGIMKGMIS